MKKIPLISFVVFASIACGKSEPPPPANSPPPAPLPALAPPVVPSTELLDFEGEVGLLVRSSDTKRVIPPLLVQIKGDKFRFDVPEGVMGKAKFDKHAYVVVQPARKELFVVLHERKQVVKVELERLGDQIKNLAPTTATEHDKAQAAPAQLTKTGTSAQVAGRRCEEWELVTDKGGKTNLCIASESTSWFQLPTIGLPPEHAWARELFDGKHLPLRVIAFDASGAEDGRIEVTKLEKKPIADAAFEIPANFETIDLAAMIGGMMAGAFPPGLKLPPQLVGTDGKVPPHVQEMMRKMMERAQAAKAKSKKEPQ